MDLGPEARRTGSKKTTNLELLVIYLILSSNIPTSLEKATSFTDYLTPLWQISRTFLPVVILWRSIFSFHELGFPSWLLELHFFFFFLEQHLSKQKTNVLDRAFGLTLIFSTAKPAAATVPSQGLSERWQIHICHWIHEKGHYHFLRQTSWAIWFLLLCH